jgi:branched-subunit amino acid ABC-type transport system permease component
MACIVIWNFAVGCVAMVLSFVVYMISERCQNEYAPPWLLTSMVFAIVAFIVLAPYVVDAIRYFIETNPGLIPCVVFKQ